jgi:catechol 2,3-dioxygenase-like lactoylglutathione lyase family enzyme
MTGSFFIDNHQYSSYARSSTAIDERTTVNTFHLSLDVPDLDAAVAFYRELLGIEPAKEKPGYAKFELADPPLALALNESGQAGLSHLGIRVADTATVEAASARLQEKGLATLDERDTACCYARQDKVWVHDPAGNPWEVYTLLEDVEENDAAHTCCADGAACC